MRVLYILLIAVSVYAQGVTTVAIRHTSTSAPSGSTLENGLIAFWKLDEESGTRYDAIGSNDLTDNNTVLYGTGVISSAGDFESTNSERLSITDNSDLSFGAEDFTVSGWVNCESVTFGAMIGKGTNGSNFEYALYLTSQTPRFYVSNGGGANVTHSTALSLSTWYFLCAWHNETTDSIYVQINDGTPFRASCSIDPGDGSNAFNIGSIGTQFFFDGLIDLVGVWGRCPQSSNGYAMADSMYNGGAGWQPD